MIEIKDIALPESCAMCHMVQMSSNAFDADPHCIVNDKPCEADWDKKRPHWCPSAHTYALWKMMEAADGSN